MDAYDKNTIDEDDDDDEDEPRSISSSLRLPTSRLASFTLFTTSGSSSTDGFTRIMVPLNANSLTISRRHFSRPVKSLSVREIKDGQEDTSIPTPLPPHPVSRTASHEGQGQQQTNQTAEDIKMQIEVLQAKLEQMEKHNDNKGYQITENDMTCQSEISEEFKVVSKNPEENTTKNEINNTLQANETNEVPAKSDNPEIPISKLFKKHSYNKTEFNQEDFLNSLLSSPSLDAREGGLNVSQDMKFSGLKISNRNHQGPKQFSDEVINNLRSDSQWKENVNSDNEMEEDGVFENKFHEDITEVTLPLNPNIPHTRSLKTPGYEYERQDTWGATKSVKTDSKSDRDAVSPSGSNSPAIVPPGDSANPQNFPLLKYPDHSPTTGVHHATQLPPKRKSQEVPVDGNPNPVSEYDEDDIGYQEYNQSNRNTYSKGSGSSHYHSSPRYTSYMASLQSLADHNGYLIKDVTPDGNCMFSAIIDQLRIQGNFDLTPNSLRRTAVDYLRNNPKNQDGTHLESFLSTETWEEYLKRMGQESQWGDHMVLQACTEVTGQRIVVFKPNTNKTELVPTAQEVMVDYTITLGHIGESHFVSLRPTDWEATWPMKAHAHRARMKEKKKLARKRKLERQKSKEGKDQSPDVSEKGESTVDHEKETEVIEETEGATGETIKEKKVMEDEDDSGDEEEENNSQFKTTDDLMQVAVDKYSCDKGMSGVPMPHLSFIIRYLIRPIYIIDLPNKKQTLAATEGATVEFIGSSNDRLSGVLKDFGDEIRTIEKFHKPVVAGINEDAVVYIEEDVTISPIDLRLDTAECHPGYTRLIPNDPVFWKNGVFNCTNKGVCWLKHMNLNMSIAKQQIRLVSGFRCDGLPDDAMEWVTRDRVTSWPPPSLIEMVVEFGCIVVSVAHESSPLKDVEWQFVFHDAERLLIKHLTTRQRYCFRVFKVLVDECTTKLTTKLKSVHLKSVMFFACEVIGSTVWEDNCGGCIMYLLSSLESCVSEKCLPNYFIRNNNMIDHYSEEDFSVIAKCLSHIRLFPIATLSFLTESHGINQTFMLHPVIADIPNFKRDKDLSRTVTEAFVPSIILLAKAYLGNDNVTVGSMFQKAFKEYKDSACDNQLLSFEDFLLEVLNKESMEEKFALAKVLDDQFNMNLKASMYQLNDVVVVRDIAGPHYDGPIADQPINKGVLHCTLSQMKLLDDFAFRFFMTGQMTEAAKLLECGISKYDIAKSELLDVSNIEDHQVKANIQRQNDDKLREVNDQRSVMQSHLMHCRHALMNVRMPNCFR